MKRFSFFSPGRSGGRKEIEGESDCHEFGFLLEERKEKKRKEKERKGKERKGKERKKRKGGKSNKGKEMRDEGEKTSLQKKKKKKKKKKNICFKIANTCIIFFYDRNFSVGSS